MSKPCILFVDDSDNILQGLKRSLRAVRREWVLKFAISGEDAIDVIKENHIDVIVSDMRMPGMNGSELLTHAQQMAEHTFRLVLSGQCEEEVIIQLLSVSHQYLAKPFDVDQIIQTIRNMITARGLVTDEKLQTYIASLSTLPSLPSLQENIQHEINKETPSHKTLQSLIHADISLLAKLSQIINSSYFGANTHMRTIDYAWELLGLEKIRHLITDQHIIAPLDPHLGEDPFYEQFWRFAQKHGQYTQKIAAHEGMSDKEQQIAYTMGAHSSIGMLAIREYRRHSGATPLSSEQFLHDLEHSEEYLFAGNYLAQLWGQPELVTNAILSQKSYKPDQHESLQNPLIAMHHIGFAMAMAEATSRDINDFISATYQSHPQASKFDAWKNLTE